MILITFDNLIIDNLITFAISVLRNFLPLWFLDLPEYKQLYK